MDYYQGYQEGYMPARGNARYYSIGGWLIQSILTFAYLAIVLLPLLIIGFAIAESVNGTYSNDLIIKISLTIGFTYLFYSIVYFLKGITIGLRDMKFKTWIPIWLICVVSTCGLQVLISQYQLEAYFNSRHISNSILWSWLGSILLGLLVYSHYSFLTNIAPRSVFWAYKSGFDVARIFIQKPMRSHPEKSRTLFGNAQMKVSFRNKN